MLDQLLSIQHSEEEQKKQNEIYKLIERLSPRAMGDLQRHKIEKATLLETKEQLTLFVETYHKIMDHHIQAMSHCQPNPAQVEPN